MSGSKERPRDFWDKLDVISKVLSGVLLAAIALLVKLGADNIATSMRSGELVQRLISDLTTKGTRQDVALIALNRSVGDREPEMIAEIAERLIRDVVTTGTTPIEEQGPLYTTALRILEERDPARAAELAETVLDLKREKDPTGTKVLEDYILSEKVAEPSQRAELRSAPDGTVEPVRLESSARLLVRSFRNLVYVQFFGEDTRPLAEALRDRLREKDFSAPGVERVQADYRNAVRYFHAEDRPTAREVAKVVEAFFAEKQVPARFDLQDFSDRGFDVPRGQIEVWVNLWNAKVPTRAWCYQERDPSKPEGQQYSVHCHWSEKRCNEAKAGSPRATVCVFVEGLSEAGWSPRSKGWMDSWFELDRARPLPPPFPQFD